MGFSRQGLLEWGAIAFSRICLKTPKPQGSENFLVGDASWFSEGSKLREGKAPHPLPHPHTLPFESLLSVCS